MNTPESTLFNAVPVVSELNRVAGFDPLRFLKKTANGHELDLRYKKLWFRLRYPAGRTRLTPLRITDQLAIIEAKVFFDKDDADHACYAERACPCTSSGSGTGQNGTCCGTGRH